MAGIIFPITTIANKLLHTKFLFFIPRYDEHNVISKKKKENNLNSHPRHTLNTSWYLDRTLIIHSENTFLKGHFKYLCVWCCGSVVTTLTLKIYLRFFCLKSTVPHSAVKQQFFSLPRFPLGIFFTSFHEIRIIYKCLGALKSILDTALKDVRNKVFHFAINPKFALLRYFLLIFLFSKRKNYFHEKWFTRCIPNSKCCCCVLELLFIFPPIFYYYGCYAWGFDRRIRLRIWMGFKMNLF